MKKYQEFTILYFLEKQLLLYERDNKYNLWEVNWLSISKNNVNINFFLNMFICLYLKWNKTYMERKMEMFILVYIYSFINSLN